MSKYTPKQFSPRLYPEWGELLSDLPAEKQAEIFNAILKYPNVELNSGIWRFIKSQIDKDYEEFLERSNKNKEAIKNYWDKKTIDNRSIQSLEISQEQETHVDETTIEETNVNERYPSLTIDNEGKPITNNINRNKNINDEHKQSVATCFVEQAERLAGIVRSRKNIKINQNKITSWAKSFEQLHRIEGVAIERIDKALGWYGEHVGEQYVSVVESGSAFREKFLKLEGCMERQENHLKLKNGLKTEKTATLDDILNPPKTEEKRHNFDWI